MKNERKVIGIARVNWQLKGYEKNYKVDLIKMSHLYVFNYVDSL